MFTEKLLNGIVNFRNTDFQAHEGLFKELKDKQKPHTLFITCSDSRIDPNMITGALPGELFIIRNVANIIPPYRETTEFVSTTSAIEYSVLMLGVKYIIVCGHSNCGGCAAGLNEPAKLQELPHTKKWLELVDSAKKRILTEFAEYEPGAREWMMEQINVVEQLRHLMTYPYVYEKVVSGQLQISGWHYIIETGEVFIYDRKAGEFRLANGS